MSNSETKRGRKPVRVSDLRRNYSELDDIERISYAARLFCKGATPSKIQRLLSDHFGEEVRREEPYRLLQLGAALGYFRYRPPLEANLGERLRDKWRSVSEAHVVQTHVLDDVTARAAEVLLRVICEVWESKREANERNGKGGEDDADVVRIGLAGGHTVFGIVRALAELLKRADPDTVPKSLGFHTACAGVHFHDSSTDPNAFISHLLRVPGVDTHTFAVPYHAPPVTKPDLRAMLEKEPINRIAARSFSLIDIVVTSGSSWRISEILDKGEIVPAPSIFREEGDDIYSQLKELMKEYDKQGYKRLRRAGTVADLLWQPLAFDGPVEVDTKVKAMTLAPLRGLPALIKGGKKVLLTLGPYYRGGEFHKGDVLFAALGGAVAAETNGRPNPMFTHLVCDHRTARAAIKAASKAAES